MNSALHRSPLTYRFQIFFKLLITFGSTLSLVGLTVVDAQCNAGKAGLLASSCFDCNAGYFCPQDSINRFGWSGAMPISTLAGSSVGGSDGTGTSATFNAPYAVAIDPRGYFALVVDTSNHRIRRIDIASGVVTTIAGSSLGSADGTGTSATFNGPTGVAIEPTSGSIALVTDFNNHVIRRIDIASGIVSTFATGLGAPSGVAIASSGSFALVTEYNNNRVSRVSMSSGTVTVVAGSAAQSGSVDGTGTSALFYRSFGVAIDPSETFALVADTQNHLIRRIDLTSRVVTTLAGSTNFGSSNGVGTLARFRIPSGVAIDPSGLFALIADSENNRIRRIDISTATVTTLVGSGSQDSTDGIGTSAALFNPNGIAIDQSGSFALVADNHNNRIRLISTQCSAGYFCPAGSSSVTQSLCNAGSYCPPASINMFGWSGSMKVSTIAGSFVGSIDGVGTAALFKTPYYVAIDSTGTFALVTDYGNYRIRRINIATGVVSTFETDNIFPSGIAIDPSGTFAVAVFSYYIRRIEIATGAVSLLAGSSVGSTDATGTSASFFQPEGVAIDSTGTFVLLSDTFNHRIRRIEIATGVVTTVAGNSAGSADGTGTLATFNYQKGLAIDPFGVFALIADTNNNRLRRIEIASKVVTTLAGSSSGIFDGVGTFAKFNAPYDVAIDPSGVFALVTERTSNRIRRVVISTGAVSTLAGLVQGSLDGTGTLAQFYSPAGVAISPNGKFALVADSQNNIIRMISIQCSAGYYCPTGSSSATQLPCNAGFYCPAGSSSGNQSKCGAGYYCPAGASSILSQISCSAGFYCPAGSSSATQFLCRAGFFCPAGSSIANQSICSAGFYCLAGSSALSAQIVCSAGYYCTAGSSSATQSICAAGYYCPAGSSSVSAQIPCNAGFYCPAGSSSASQSLCGVGFFCPVGSSSATQSICNAGYFCPSGSSSANQSICNSGYYCPAGSSIATQSICDAGFYCPAGSSSIAAQIPCNIGSYCPAGSSSANQTTCGAGYFCLSPAAQFACAGGYYCPAGTTSNVGAGQCDAGFYCPAGSSSARQVMCPIRNYCPPFAAFTGGIFLACQLGTYCNASGLSSGTVCDAGSYCAGTLLTAPSGSCQAGYYCPAGSFNGNSNACPAGSYCPAGSSINIFCPTRTYCSATGLSAASSALPCLTNQICPAGSVSPSVSCPPGFTCVGNGAVPCSAGYYCPGGNDGSVACPAGTFCSVGQLAAPVPCSGGYYCATTGLTFVSTQCAIGQVCVVGSSAPANCPIGFMCASRGLSVPTSCPSGKACSNLTASTCPSGTYTFGNSTSCLRCPKGLYAASAGSSSCFLCSFGSYSNNGISCSRCPSGSSCLFGASLPIGIFELQQILNSNPESNNPFQSELRASSDSQSNQTLFVLGAGSAFIFTMLAIAIASQKVDCIGHCLNCRSGSLVTWVDLDIFFSHSHWTPADSTLPAQHRKTSFGGMVSMILIFTVVLVSIQLGTSNLVPTFSSMVSIESPMWQPHGFYSLSLTIFGSGLQNCAGNRNEISIQWSSADWSGLQPITKFTYNSTDGSCLATWTCSLCKIISTSTTSLRFIVSSNSFSTHAQYTLMTPPFTSSAADLGAEYQGPFSVKGFVASSDFSNLTAFQGGASVVTALLTVFNVTVGSQQKIAYQPVISNTLAGPVVTPDNFDFSKQIGFEYRFDLTRNSFSIVNLGQSSNVFNLIVLLLSLAGSIISGFLVLLPELEKRLQIDTIWGAPAVKGDVVCSWSDKISEIDGRLTGKTQELAEQQQLLVKIVDALQAKLQASFAKPEAVPGLVRNSSTVYKTVPNFHMSLLNTLPNYYEDVDSSTAALHPSFNPKSITSSIELAKSSQPIVQPTKGSLLAQNSGNPRW